MDDVYYNPEKFNLEIVAEIDFGGSYEFDKYVVWKSTVENKFYWAHDSGCSCPSPFEDYLTIDSLDVLNDQTFGNLENAIKNDTWNDPDERGGLGKREFINSVEKAFRGR